MGDVVLVQNSAPATVVFGFQMSGLRFSALPGLASPPNGLHLKDASEFSVGNCYFGQNLAAGVKLNGAAIGHIDGCETSTNQVGIRFAIDGAAVLTYNDAVWVRNANIWNSSVAGVLVDSSLDDSTIKDSWIEQAPAGVLVAPVAGTNLDLTKLTLADVHFANGGATPYGNARFFKALAENTAAHYLNVNNVTLRSCKAFTSSAVASDYLVELLQNGNTNPATSLNRFAIENGWYQGSAIATLNSDDLPTGHFFGQIISRNAAGADVPLVAGTGRWATLRTNLAASRWTQGETEFSAGLMPATPAGATQAARVFMAGAAPVAGTFVVGDRVINNAPAVGQPKGWACTVAGTPGTWVSEGNL